MCRIGGIRAAGSAGERASSCDVVLWRPCIPSACAAIRSFVATLAPWLCPIGPMGLGGIGDTPEAPALKSSALAADGGVAMTEGCRRPVLGDLAPDLEGSL